ncbi:MAG: HAD family hydrolase [Calditrichaeota bacterium]|nr:MAG: hypothetical protein DWQ03_18605 [Calditrichota bacterium]MBL1205301.1 HAD family hydrolase [Calditrichota bacterium]NOG45130.1 HAD hydrolase-like protein [Calditrichota bacterium]
MKKLLLFDIDGTLITGRGIPKKVALNVIQKHFPNFKNGNEVRFNGMTDPLIVQQVLASNNHKIELDDPIINIILDDFLCELKKHVTPQTPPDILPGVENLLKTCSLDNAIFMGLVTGNMMHGAKIKLNAAGLDSYFSLGAFGSDHWNRNELPPIAISRADKYFGKTFLAEDTWIIGDSPKDVECAKANGLKCLAVLTGKIDKQVMLKAGADFVMQDLGNLEEFFSIIKNS